MAVIVNDAKTGKPKRVCGQPLRRGGICHAYPVRGREKCRLHGGKVPRGADHPHFKHGRYSKDLRRDLLFDYFHALEQEDLYDQSDEIAVLEARLKYLMRQASAGETYEDLIASVQTGVNELNEIIQEYKRRKDADSKLELDALRRVETAMVGFLRQISNEQRFWEEYYTVVDQHRKLIESERKRELDSQKLMTEQQVHVLLTFLTNLIRKYVPDAHARNQIAAELIQLSAVPISRQIEAESGS